MLYIPDMSLVNVSHSVKLAASPLSPNAIVLLVAPLVTSMASRVVALTVTVAAAGTLIKATPPAAARSRYFLISALHSFPGTAKQTVVHAHAPPLCES